MDDKENVPMSVLDSPKRNKGTSKVIDQLHSTIDTLKQELSDIRVQGDDYKKKFVSLTKRHDHVVDQLANAKHENDMVQALLKRKERRILDLESQYSDSLSSTETLQLKVKNLEIRCSNLSESSASSVAEYERLKIAYDAIVTSQNEYRSHFSKEVVSIKSSLNDFIEEKTRHLTENSAKFDSSNQEFDKMFSNLAAKAKNLENIYSSKNNTIVDALKNLALAAKTHGEETRCVLGDCENALDIVYKHFPEFKRADTKEPAAAVDVSELLAQTTEISEANTDSKRSSLDSTTSETGTAANSNPYSNRSFIPNNNNKTRRRKGTHKRNSSRVENFDFNELQINKRSSMNGSSLADSSLNRRLSSTGSVNSDATPTTNGAYNTNPAYKHTHNSASISHRNSSLNSLNGNSSNGPPTNTNNANNNINNINRRKSSYGKPLSRNPSISAPTNTRLNRRSVSLDPTNDFAPAARVASSRVEESKASDILNSLSESVGN